MPDIQEAATRKLGPLPAWGWGVAVGGAILVFRLFRGGKSATPNAGYTPTAGGTGVIGSAGDATPTDEFSGSNSLVEQLMTQVQTMSGYQQLQVQLSSHTERLANALFYINRANLNISNYQNEKAKCTTDACRQKFDAYIATANDTRKRYERYATSERKTIASLQTQLAAQ